MHCLFVVKEGVIKCFPFQMKSHAWKKFIGDVLTWCCFFVETASSSPVTLKAMTGVYERKSYCE